MPVWRLSPTAQVSAGAGSPIASAIDAVFGAFAAAPVTSGVTRPLELSLERRADSLLIAADRRPIVHVEHEDALAPVFEAMLVGLAVRSRADAAVFHAADVRIGGRSALLVGAKGSGKSTLAARFALVGEGAYGGDEIAFVPFSDRRVESFPKSATLKPGSFSLFPASRTHADPIRGPVRYVVPSSPAPPGSQAEIAMLVFPRYAEDGPEALAEPIEPGEVGIELVRQSFGGLDRHPSMIDLVADLSRLFACRLVFSNGERAAAVIRSLIERRTE
jgi:hypothetical protein